MTSINVMGSVPQPDDLLRKIIDRNSSRPSPDGGFTLVSRRKPWDYERFGWYSFDRAGAPCPICGDPGNVAKEEGQPHRFLCTEHDEAYVLWN